MLSHILDRVLFERRFQKILKLSDLPIILEGNRIAEMFGVSPSYGKQYNVLKLRQLYRERLPQALYYGRQSTQPSSIVALKFICELFNEFISIEQNEELREFSADTVERAALLAHAKPTSDWQLVIEIAREKRRKERQRFEERLPALMAARQVAQREFSHNFSLLDQEKLPGEALQVWLALTDEQFMAEWQITEKANVPIALICRWVPIFVARDLAVAIGTSLDEPKYRRSPIRPKHQANLNIRQKLDQVAMRG